MKKQILGVAAAALSLCVLAGCSRTAGIVSVEKTGTNGLTDIYTITYSDGREDVFEITNGKDGAVTASDAYETYKSIYGDTLTYDEFLQRYLGGGEGIAKAVNASLLSSLKIASEFQVYSTSGSIFRPTYTLTPAVQQGSAVIYRIDDDYTYAITNYHVIYNANAQNGKESTKTFAYIYGSEQTPQTDGSGEYVYGDSAIPCEYVGGEISYDIAVLKMSTAELKKRNPNVAAVEAESEFVVGETVYSVGNTEGLGIAVNSGVISVDSEYISLKIDGTPRYYRSIRMDAAIHEGNSGGGLFNAEGKLIGINNAGSSAASSMNYAIPASIATGVADNILHYYNGAEAVGAKKLTLGVTLEGKNSRFEYDSNSGYGKIREDISVKEVTQASIASTLKIEVGDIICAISVNGKEYSLNRFYELGDLLLTVRAGDELTISYKRNGAPATASFTVKEEDLKEIE